MKHCTRCQDDKPIDDYYKDKNKKDGRQQWCKSCVSETQKLWRKENPERRSQWSKKSYYKDHEKSKKRVKEGVKKWSERNPQKLIANKLDAKLKLYGLTRSEYDALLIKQDCKCAICKRSQYDLPKDLSIDHDHKTGKVRGLLCWSCNVAIGHLKDNPELALNASKYLTG